MKKRNTLLSMTLIVVMTLFKAYGQCVGGNPGSLYLNPIRYTDVGVQAYNMNCGSASQVHFTLNGAPFSNTLDANGNPFYYITEAHQFGFHFIKFPFGVLKPGDVIAIYDDCGSTPTSRVVQDDFIYVEVPNGNSYTGNGIGPFDTGSQYSRLGNRLQVGQCEPIPINAHILMNWMIFSACTSDGTTGKFLINNIPLGPSVGYTINTNGAPNTNPIVNPDGSFRTNGTTKFESTNPISGASQFIMEYQNNGYVIPPSAWDFSMELGGIRIEFYNGSVKIIKRNYLGTSIVNVKNVSNPNYILQVIFDQSNYIVKIDGNEVDIMPRTVVYSTDGGVISNTGQLGYRTGVTFTPSQSGDKYVQAIIDGVRLFVNFSR